MRPSARSCGCVPSAVGTWPLACGYYRWHARRPPLARPLLHAAVSACSCRWHARPLLHAVASAFGRRLKRLPSTLDRLGRR
ncbi:hypothetical protein BHM03_00028477 [Ensete ventricosum]|nr:hypothetical protein BHM03_00028477 [Ensete ventricosum]